MNVIFDRQIAESLSSKYVVLELETFPAGDKLVETFCVVDGDKIPLNEMPMLANYKMLHQQFVLALNEKNYDLCSDLLEHLLGKWGGELDSFYNTIAERIKSQPI